MESSITKINTVNSPLTVTTAPAEKPLQRTQSKENNNKKLLLALSGLAVLGLGTALILKNKKVKAKDLEKLKPKAPETTKLPDNIRGKLIKKYKMNESFYAERPYCTYRDLMYDNFYNKIRKAATPYSTRTGCIKNIGNVTGSSNHSITSLPEGGWHYRLPNRQANAPIVDRISLNVYPEADLIRKLDNFVANSKGMVEYKTPMGFSEWNKRHDPITIYFRHPVNKADEAEIIKLASAHIRPTKDEVLIGRKIANGIYQVPEPTEKDVQALIERAEKLGDPDLINVMKDPSNFGLKLFSESGKVHTSPGVVESVKRLLDEMEKLV